MTSVIDSKRRLIPRWRPFSKVSEPGEIGPLDRSRPIDSKLLEDLTLKKKMWNKNKSIDQAMELVVAATVYGMKEEALQAADYLASNDEVMDGLKYLAKSIFIVQERPSQIFVKALTAAQNISLCKVQLALYPRNPILWIDQAYHYAALGQLDKARKSVQIALHLNDNNRYILRSAARFYLHDNEQEKAHHILLMSPLVKFDPWVMSAEISISSILEKKSAYFKKAKATLEGRSFKPADISELAGSIGTSLLVDGAKKNAKKMFSLCLKDPTENSIAQSAWANPQLTSSVAIEQYLDIEFAHEARAIELSKNLEWKNALIELDGWSSIENFSARPYVNASYIYSVALDNPQMALKKSQDGLIANPNDPTLLNNCAVGFAQLGRIKDAKEMLYKAKINSIEEIGTTLIATEGLIAYRENDISNGRSLYFDAIEKSKKLPSKRVSALATLYFLNEESSATGLDVTPILEGVEKYIANDNFPELSEMIARIKKKKNPITSVQDKGKVFVDTQEMERLNGLLN